MSDPSKAVFLSYASQDAAAARRIADALRQAGIEVWFDQSELVGGDAWDQKIRKQIKDCALLIPIISAATQARTEGYFRLEWRLADQRTHLMAKGRPFLLPVVIDDTRDSDAQVPDSFTEVQWTRLRPVRRDSGGQAPDDASVAAFCVRVKRLLSGDAPVGAAPQARGRNDSEGSSQPESRPRGGGAAPTKKRWLLASILSVGTIAALAIWQPWKSSDSDLPARPELARGEPAESAERATVPTSDAHLLVAKAWEQLNKTGRSRPELEMAERLCRQAAELDPDDAEVWAAWSQVDTWYYYSNLERTPARREGASSKAARALRIAPDSYEARLAQACFLVREEPHEESIFADEAERQLRRLLEERAEEPRALFALGILLRNGLRHDEGAQVFDRLARQPGFAATALSEKGFLRLFEGRFQEAGECADQSIAVERFYGNLALKTFVAVDWYGDLDQARDAVEMMPAAALMEDYGAGAAYDVYWRRREPDKMLKVLRAVPREWLSSNNLSGPKQFYVGVAHQMAGRLDAARTEWRTALEMLNLRLQTDPNNSEWHFVKAKLLVWLGGNKEDSGEHFRLAQDFAADAWQKFGVDVESAIVSGDVDGAIRVLEQSAKNGLRRATAAALRTSPMYDPIRADPRFQALLARVDADPRLSPNARPSAPADRKHVDEKSVAVLAFANLSDDKGNEYFSDGISEELLNVLAKISGLKVSARTSAFYFKGKEVPIPEIARQLGVAYVVEGSVRKQGDTVRITAQLIKAADGFHVWSDTFTRDLKDIFAVQDEIAGLIARQLQLKLGNSTRVAREVNPEAYRLVLEGRYFWNQRSSAALARAEESYARALAIDPDFAEAHAALADLWVIGGWYLDMAGGSESVVSDYFAKARAEADRALALDPRLADAHAALGAVLFSEFEFDEAVRQFARAVALNPNRGNTRHWHSIVLAGCGRIEEAYKESEVSVSLDPLLPTALWNAAAIRYHDGHWNETLALCDRALAVRPGFLPVMGYQTLVLWGLGRKEEAVAVARAIAADHDGEIRWEADYGAIYVLAQSGLTEEAEALVERISAPLPPDSHRRAFALAAAGRGDEALNRLKTFPPMIMNNFASSPMWDPWREDPRFRRLMADNGSLADYERTRGAIVRLRKEQEKNR